MCVWITSNTEEIVPNLLSYKLVKENGNDVNFKVKGKRDEPVVLNATNTCNNWANTLASVC